MGAAAPVDPAGTDLLGGSTDELFVALAGRVAKGSFGQVTARLDEEMPSWPSGEGGQEG